ncbi:hypothetical protein ACLOJK_013407 [Asimina triloba]
MGWRGILGFETGIVQAPLGPDISSPELAAAVANAGGIGFLRAPDWECPEYLKGLIRKTRSLTDKPFGVAVVLAFPHHENVKAILEEKVGLLLVSWGEYPKELVSQAHHVGVKVVHQVGSLDAAQKARDAGVDAIIVQGREAGGHVLAEEGLVSLLPRIADLVSGYNITVIATGGIVDSRGYVAALALGAHGICLGTRFLATKESYAHPVYKKKLVELEKTEHTDIFGRARWPGAPERVLQTDFFNEWRQLPDHENETNQPVIGHTVIHGMDKNITRFAGTVPNETTTGDIESMAMYAGEGVGLIKEILPAAEVVKMLVDGAKRIIECELNSGATI